MTALGLHAGLPPLHSRIPAANRPQGGAEFEILLPAAEAPAV